MTIDVNKQVKEVTYNGTPLVLVGGGTGGTNIDTGLVPNNGFIPKTIDGEGYITSGTWYGEEIPLHAFNNNHLAAYYNLDYYGRLVTVNLPDNLIIIRESAFEGCTNLTLTSLPDGIGEISVYAFYDCKNLALTSLPNSLTKIGDRAFWGCDNLTTIVIPAGVTYLGAFGFAYCSNLTTVTFKGTPTELSRYAFSNDDNITTINVPWSEGDIEYAPWGATNATINYDYVG